jgi:hypothetical protein
LDYRDWNACRCADIIKKTPIVRMLATWIRIDRIHLKAAFSR